MALGYCHVTKPFTGSLKERQVGRKDLCQHQLNISNCLGAPKEKCKSRECAHPKCLEL